MNPLLDALGWVGETLDKPGRALRGLLAGRPGELANLVPFSDTRGWTDPSQSVSGRNLLENWGALAPKGEDEGFGLGDIAGMGLEAALDPTNFVGAGALKRLIGIRRTAAGSNALRDANLAKNLRTEELISKGAMPQEVARATKAVDAAGNPVATYHGTPHAFDMYDPAKMDPEGLFGPGPGGYHTVNPDMANTYIDKGATDRTQLALKAGAEMEAINRLKNSGDFGYLARHDYRRPLSYETELAELQKVFEQANLPRSQRITGVYADPSTLQSVLGDLVDVEQFVSPRNVRKEFLDIRNPFDIESRISMDQLSDLSRRITGNPNYIRKPVSLGERELGMSGQDFYDKLVRSAALADEHSPGLLSKFLGLSEKESVNNILQDLGYDAIQHMGGGRAGGGEIMHQVYIPFSPKQVYKPLVAPGLESVPDFMRAPRLSPLLSALGAQNVLARQ